MARDARVAALERAVAADPRNAEAWFDLGNLRAGHGDTRGAIDALQRARALAPGVPSVLVNLGVELARDGRRDEAERCYREVLASRPMQLHALANLAALLLQERRHAEARPLYERLLPLGGSGSAEVWNNLGVCQKYTWDADAALASFRRAHALAPDAPQVLANLGIAESEGGDLAAARTHLARAAQLAPSRLELVAHLVDLDLRLADWPELAARRDALVHGVTNLAPGDVVPPFAFMAVCDDPALQQRAAHSFAWPESDAPPLAPPGPRRAGGLRLGFVSTAFHEHPVARLVIGLFERLDRTRFEVHAYLVARGAQDDGLQERVAAVATLHDVAGRPAADIARQVRGDGIDVLFDLAGHTAFARPDVFAQRPAPIQVNFLGHAGTLGARYYDYVATDRCTTPPSEQANWSERFWYVGECYLPSDPARGFAEPAPTRAEYGLPADAFVLACHAATWKIAPPLFDAWMRLLQAIPGAVLWLRPMPGAACANLAREADRHGVDVTRLVFAPQEALARYLARYRLADVFVDTHPFGSHTNVNDALWAGLPVVTLAGRSAAARASAAQLHAVGLPELAVSDIGAYEALVVALARDRARLAALTARLRGTARSSPLFDMERYARGFEAAVRELVGRAARGDQAETAPA